MVTKLYTKNETYKTKMNKKNNSHAEEILLNHLLYLNIGIYIEPNPKQTKNTGHL